MSIVETNNKHQDDVGKASGLFHGHLSFCGWPSQPRVADSFKNLRNWDDSDVHIYYTKALKQMNGSQSMQSHRCDKIQLIDIFYPL